MNQRLKGFLTASVVLNVLLAGVLLGEGASRNLTASPPSEAELVAKLPQDKRKLFTDIMGPAENDMNATRAKIVAAKTEALRLLKVEPFNESTYFAQIQSIYAMHTQMKIRVALAVTKLARELLPQERAILAEILSQPPYNIVHSAAPGATPNPSGTAALR